jgi:O-antigen ligase
MSPQFKERFNLVIDEVQSYRKDNDNTTSQGMRLHFWTLSLQAIAERPLTGFGVGAWSQQYLRLQNQQPVPGTEQVRNPHQEFLLWGVLLGVGGAFLLALLLLAMARDSRGFRAPTCQALLSVITVLTLSAMFNSVLFDAVTGEFFCFAIGILLVFGYLEKNSPRTVPASA